MSYKQVHEVLDRARLYYRQLSDYYEHVSDEVEHDEHLRLLLRYMGRHEDAIKRTLARYGKSAAEGVLNTWLQYAPDERTWRTLQTEIRPEMSIEEVMEQALEVDQKLRELYKQLAEESSVPRVKELFQSLLEMEQSKDARFARSILEEVQTGSRKSGTGE